MEGRALLSGLGTAPEALDAAPFPAPYARNANDDPAPQTREHILLARQSASGPLGLDDFGSPPPKVTAHLVGGTLKIRGTPNDDSIFVYQHSLQIFVPGTVINFNGAKLGAVPAGLVQSIEVDAYGGDDTVRLDVVPFGFQMLAVPSDIHGGEGDDWIYGSNRDDFLVGGGGSDHIYGLAGDDTLTDDTTHYETTNDPGDDWLYGGSGEDRLFSYIGIDALFGGDHDDEIVAFYDYDAANSYDYVHGEAGADTLYVNEEDIVDPEPEDTVNEIF